MAPEESRRVRLRTAAEVAERLGVSPTTVLRYYDAGELVGADLSATCRRGRHRRMIRFRDLDIEAFEQRRFR